MQDHDRASLAPALVQIDHLAALVRQPDIGERLADLRPAITVVELDCHLLNLTRAQQAGADVRCVTCPRRAAARSGQRAPRSAASICCVSSVNPSAS